MNKGVDSRERRGNVVVINESRCVQNAKCRIVPLINTLRFDFGREHSRARKTEMKVHYRSIEPAMRQNLIKEIET